MSSTPPEGPEDQPSYPPSYGQQPPPQPQQPPPAYEQGYPPAGGHPYGQAFPGAGDPRQEAPPSKAMAITSLVLSLLFCVPFLAAIVSIVLGVIVLGRSRDGRDHGRGMAIAGIVISTLVLLATVALLVVAVVLGISSLKDVNDLQRGDCISADNLTDGDAEGFGQITVGSCTDEHDAEVVAVKTLDAEEAERYASASTTEICQSLVLDDPELLELVAPGIELLTITNSAEPAAGDKVACILFNADGSPLDEPLLD